jgi:hypothetical protein
MVAKGVVLDHHDFTCHGIGDGAFSPPTILSSFIIIMNVDIFAKNI